MSRLKILVLDVRALVVITTTVIALVVLRTTAPWLVQFAPSQIARGTPGVQIWSFALCDLQTGSRQTLLGARPGLETAITFSPDGAQLASANADDHHVRLRDLKTQKARHVLIGYTPPLKSIAFSPDGSLIDTAGDDGTVGLWNVATG
jgi:WD domain, G-beta repeat